MTHFLLSFLLVLAAPAAFAQQPGSPGPAPAQAPIVLTPGHMQAQAHGAANRPDKAPAYPGGPEALGVFFQQHVKYPEAARVKQLSGVVLVTATVNADGSVSNPRVAQSLSAECDAEALRAVALLTGWQPATRKGQPLPVLVQLPVPFGGGGELKVEVHNRPTPSPTPRRVP